MEAKSALLQCLLGPGGVGWRNGLRNHTWAYGPVISIYFKLRGSQTVAGKRLLCSFVLNCTGNLGVDLWPNFFRPRWHRIDLNWCMMCTFKISHQFKSDSSECELLWITITVFPRWLTEAQEQHGLESTLSVQVMSESSTAWGNLPQMCDGKTDFVYLFAEFHISRLSNALNHTCGI